MNLYIFSTLNHGVGSKFSYSMISQGSLFYEKSSHTPHIFSDNFTNTDPMKLKSVAKQNFSPLLPPYQRRASNSS